MQTALTASATIINSRRLYRSASIPLYGESRACGSKAASPATARARATARAETLPVVSVIHQSSTNYVSGEPINDSA